jgi:nucleoside-diphosphate-sugar epimerase
MKVFITGATGFIGSHLAEEALRRGWEVVTLVRNPQNLKWLKGLNVEIKKGDLFNIPILPEDISVVFNVSGSTKETKKGEFMETNCYGVRSLLQSISKSIPNLKSFIHVSSLAAVGPSPLNEPAKEDRKPSPISKYGRSKYCGEIEALSFSDKMKIIIVRPPIIYGPRDRDLLPVYSMVKKGICFYLGGGERYFSLCYVKDLVKIICDLSLLNLPSGEILNISHPEILSWNRLMEILVDTIKPMRFLRLKIPVPLVYPVAFFSDTFNKISKKGFSFTFDKFREMKASHWICDTSKILSLIPDGFHYNFEKGIKETINWYKEIGWI